MEDRGLQTARAVARDKGVPNWETLQVAERKGKRFFIRTPMGRLVSFGAWPLASGTFMDHHDEGKKKGMEGAPPGSRKSERSGNGPFLCLAHSVVAQRSAFSGARSAENR
jgi:hypothetical protein